MLAQIFYKSNKQTNSQNVYLTKSARCDIIIKVRETESFSPKTVSRDIKTEKEGILWRIL